MVICRGICSCLYWHLSPPLCWEDLYQHHLAPSQIKKKKDILVHQRPEPSFFKDSADPKLLFEPPVVISSEFLAMGTELLQNLHPGEGLDPENLMKNGICNIYMECWNIYRI